MTDIPAQIRNNARARAYAMLLVAQIAMGSGGVFGRFALVDMGPFTVAAWRMLLVAVPLLLRALLRQVPALSAKLEMELALAGAVLALQMACWIHSLEILTVGTSTLLVCTAPLWGSLIEAFALGRRLPRSFWAALGVAFVGVALMVQGDAHAPWAWRTVQGVACALGAGMGMASYFLLMRRVSRAAQAQKTYDTLDLLTRTCTVAAALLLLMGHNEAPLPSLSHWQAWLGIVGMALVTQGVGHTLQNAALGHVRASLVGFATLVEPLVATLLAAWVFHETLAPPLIAGGVLVTVALGWALWITVPQET